MSIEINASKAKSHMCDNTGLLFFNIIILLIILLLICMSEVQLIGDSQITMDFFFLPLDNNLKTKTMLGFFYLNFSFSSFIIDGALQHVQLNCYDLTLPSVFYSVCSIYCI